MNPEKQISRTAKILYVALGLLCTALGGIGIVLPLLPTTPFFILSSWFFLRSSPRLQRWLEGTKAYQRTAGAFLATGGLTIKAKLSILVPVLILLTVMFFSVESTVLKMLAVLLGTVKTIVFIKVKTIRSPVSDRTLVKKEDPAL